MSDDDEFIPDPILRDMLLYSFMRALAPLIPIPFVDDLTEDALGRNLFLLVGQANGRILAKEDLDQLICQGRSGCRGCLLDVALWPLRSLRTIKRLVFAPLEVKRVVDSTSRYFIEAYLVYQIMRAQRWPDGESARVRRVLTHVCRQVGTRPVELLLGKALRGAGRKIQEVLEQLLERLRRLGGKQGAVTQALHDMESEQDSLLSRLLESWMVWLRQLPRDYRDQLTQAALEGLESPTI